LSALLKERETLEAFFQKLRGGEASARERWNVFLMNLAKALNMLHLIFDTDFILGGYLAPYLRKADLVFLHERIREMTPFAEEADFLLISKMPRHNITIGAALPYIQAFLDTLPEA